ncbi:hypothetical protein SAMN02745206_01238 [Desulfacinum infernum DSM 9756]|uniref:Uncharacterized protein n=1 Tax=Desulfacinum infernum DSM 9756 TaxID=1121391 RepID=A0A1M4YF15_9BACT|nr:hypothetical protein [Desulfacinum infernum]SHF04203.1 hypothetical protein SAMN02745206_01238 [Desulfacinum infernum DSM 9756]
MSETPSPKTQFTWCIKEERFLPLLRCLVCKTPCDQARRGNPDDVGAAADALVEAGRIKEYFVMTAKARSQEKTPESAPRFFFLENGSLRELKSDEYSRTTVYEAIGSYGVERRFVRPEEKNDILYEGKKPPKKTVPLLVLKDGGEVILSDWKELEAEPERLAAVQEVVVARPVKQVFVLKAL